VSPIDRSKVIDRSKDSPRTQQTRDKLRQNDDEQCDRNNSGIEGVFFDVARIKRCTSSRRRQQVHRKNPNGRKHKHHPQSRVLHTLATTTPPFRLQQRHSWVTSRLVSKSGMRDRVHKCCRVWRTMLIGPTAGVIRRLEETLSVLCSGWYVLLHANELPLRHLFQSPTARLQARWILWNYRKAANDV